MFKTLCLQIIYSFVLSADASSGVIRLYDGRGGDTPLETVDSVHRFPVHVMTVRIRVQNDLRLSLFFELAVQRSV